MTKILERSSCAPIASAMRRAIAWDTTPEGGAFWERVYARFNDWGSGRDPINKVYDDGVTDGIKTENQRLTAKIEALNAEISSQAQTIVELRRKLMIADFVNMGPGRNKF